MRSKPRRGTACRASAGAARGVLRIVSGPCLRVRRFARGGRQASSQRRELLLRDGDLGRVLSFGFPLRLSPGYCISRSSRERLEREFDIDLIATAPSVIYQVSFDRRHGCRSCTIRRICPSRKKITRIEEPWIEATILVPDEYLGAAAETLRGPARPGADPTYAGARAMLVYDLPLDEVVFDFYDRLKSVTTRLCDFDYQVIGYRGGRPGQDADPRQRRARRRALDASSIAPGPRRAAAAMVRELKDLIPRHLFKIPIQAAIGGKIIARETITRHAEGRDGQMLWRRHHPQAQAAR